MKQKSSFQLVCTRRYRPPILIKSNENTKYDHRESYGSKLIPFGFHSKGKSSIRSRSLQFDNFSKGKYELLTFHSLIFLRFQIYITARTEHIDETCLHKQIFLPQSSKLTMTHTSEYHS